MPKSLAELAAERDFIPAEQTQEAQNPTGAATAQEAQEPTPAPAATMYDSIADQLRTTAAASDPKPYWGILTDEEITALSGAMSRAAVNNGVDFNADEFNTAITGNPLDSLLESMTAAITLASAPDTIFTPETQRMVTNTINSIAAILRSDLFIAVKENMEAIKAFVAQMQESIAAASGVAERVRPLLPFLYDELRDMQNDPQYKDLTLSDVVKTGFDENGDQIESAWKDLIERAKARKAQYEADTGTIEEITAAWPLLQSLTPERHTMPNNALVNTMQQKPVINTGAFDMTVSKGKGKRKEITAYTIIEYDSGESSETGVTITPTNFTEYERQVSDAVISLWVQADTDKLPPVFTTDMIYRAMPGAGDKASPQQKGAITKALEKMRKLHIYVDATEEMRRRGQIKENETFIIDDFYLSATRAEYKVKNGGQITTAYRLNAEPIALVYATMTNQILTIPAKYIEIREPRKGLSGGLLVNMTPNRQAMTGYLLRQIAWIKYDRKHKVSPPRSDVILFDTLFKTVGIDTSSRTNTNRQRDFIFSVLEYEKQVGYISGYVKQSKGRSITGVKIIP